MRAAKLGTLSPDNGESFNNSAPPPLILQVAYGHWAGYRKTKRRRYKST